MCGSCYTLSCSAILFRNRFIRDLILKNHPLKKDIKWVRSLQQKKFRSESSCFVVEGLKGVEEKYILEDSKNPVALPSNLNEAIIEMEKSQLVRETLGEHVFEYVLRNKRAEWLDYSRQVSAFELDRYLPVL